MVQSPVSVNTCDKGGLGDAPAIKMQRCRAISAANPDCRREHGNIAYGEKFGFFEIFEGGHRIEHCSSLVWHGCVIFLFGDRKR